MLLVLVVVASTSLPGFACESASDPCASAQCTCPSFSNILLEQVVNCKLCDKTGCKPVIHYSDTAIPAELNLAISAAPAAASVGCAKRVELCALKELPQKLAPRAPPKSILALLSSIRLLI